MHPAARPSATRDGTRCRSRSPPEAGGPGCRDQAHSRASALEFMRHDGRGGCAASRPIRRVTVWSPIADAVQFQPTASFNVPGIVPE